MGMMILSCLLSLFDLGKIFSESVNECLIVRGYIPGLQHGVVTDTMTVLLNASCYTEVILLRKTLSKMGSNLIPSAVISPRKYLMTQFCTILIILGTTRSICVTIPYPQTKSLKTLVSSSSISVKLASTVWLHFVLSSSNNFIKYIGKLK